MCVCTIAEEAGKTQCKGWTVGMADVGEEAGGAALPWPNSVCA